jgi:hypothetical protein
MVERALCLFCPGSSKSESIYFTPTRQRYFTSAVLSGGLVKLYNDAGGPNVSSYIFKTNKPPVRSGDAGNPHPSRCCSARRLNVQLISPLKDATRGRVQIQNSWYCSTRETALWHGFPHVVAQRMRSCCRRGGMEA